MIALIDVSVKLATCYTDRHSTVVLKLQNSVRRQVTTIAGEPDYIFSFGVFQYDSS